ncbi:hydrogenase maturation nickel metallochaperone HypA [Parasulfuritortus cantonensis]|uniref:Hydrogenase maturation factor HypA n=1 Tax=Parasulfuritortus cantonensis TaxID=2528202 RepID=A0A4V2NWG1_9PROT|nr:hydrogenase maturation nickel metallochaperone HypA [Parasulfuritortus cantonensis]TCJ17172.1 hydrogenase maturation nickel metallochaperone HypA [Parasulfuritortus cantonensis]
MHEMSLAEGVMEIVEKAVAEAGCSKVKEIRLEIGALSGVEVEAMRFCMDAVLRGGPAEGAAVVFEVTPGLGWCMQCADSVPIAALYEACPRCGSYQVQATGGMEMRVKDLLVE